VALAYVTSRAPGVPRGQHQLLGWVLDREVLEFLPAVDAVLDVDEYG
jgi:hypothetical protein